MFSIKSIEGLDMHIRNQYSAILSSYGYYVYRQFMAWMHIGDMIKLSVIMHKENPQNWKKKQGEIIGRESER
jgi:hypothetical protein